MNISKKINTKNGFLKNLTFLIFEKTQIFSVKYEYLYSKVAIEISTKREMLMSHAGLRIFDIHCK